MYLIELLRAAGAAVPTAAPPDLEVAGLTADSREVRPGYLFAALAGTRSDGRAFAADAVDRGAVAILTDRADRLALAPKMRRRVAIVVDPDPQRSLARLAAQFCGRSPRTIAAVTGTNGKTPVVEFLRQIWQAAGHPAASLGTLGLITADERRPGALTTPDPVALHRDLAALHATGIGRAHVVVAGEVQRAVHHQMRPVCTQRLVLGARFCFEHARADHQLPERQRRGRRRRQLRRGERQHVGRLLLPAEARVEQRALRLTDCADT